MSLLKNIATDDSIQNEKDSVGSGGPVESGLYPSKVALAYVMKAASGALGLVTHFKTEAGRELRETFWMTSGTAKGGKNYYEKDGQKHYLPGFNVANSLALLTVGKEISELDTETKVVNVYSKEASAEVPTKVEVVTDLLNQDVILGIIKQTVNKNVKTEAGYVATAETREENTVDKIFRASDRKTTAEIRAQADEATFIDTWETKWAGNTRDRTQPVNGAPKGAPAAAANGAAKSSKPTTSLFAS